MVRQEMIEIGGEFLDTLSGTRLFALLSKRSIGSAMADIHHRPIRPKSILIVKLARVSKLTERGCLRLPTKSFANRLIRPTLKFFHLKLM